MTNVKRTSHQVYTYIPMIIVFLTGHNNAKESWHESLLVHVNYYLVNKLCYKETL